MTETADIAIAEQIWDLKYRLKAADGTPKDVSVDDTRDRVAAAVAQAEAPVDRAAWTQRFRALLDDHRYLPAGRILAGAGADRSVTLFNCFVMGTVDDSMVGIFDALKEGALTLQQGGGVGYDFSTLRPKGARVKGVGADASGPLSFMEVWDAMCRTIMSAGARRGAMMATLRCDHPDVFDFITAKTTAGRLTNFNLSVLITDPFMEATAADGDWPLVFGGETYRTVRARDLWDAIMRATYEAAEPGVIFIDRINEANNLAYCESIQATNPCVTAETWVATDAGARQVRDLIGRPFKALVDGEPHDTAPEGFFSTGVKPVLRLSTRCGRALRLTADHRIRKVTEKNRRDLLSDWVAAGDLRPGDEVTLHDHRSFDAATQPEDALGHLLGLLIGDGVIRADKTLISYWPRDGRGPDAAEADPIMTRVVSLLRSLPHRADFAGWQAAPGRGEYRIGTAALAALARDYGLEHGNKTLTPQIEAASPGFCASVLSGLFDADGSVQGAQDKGVSVRLSQSDLSLLEAAQRMLARLGVNATLYRDRRTAGESLLPDGKGDKRAYPTRAQHELVISCDNLAVFAEKIGFADPDKACRLAAALADYRREPNRERFTATVAEVVEDGSAEVFDVQVPGVNAFDANGFVVHNCGEQPLPPYGACLLGSVNLTRFIENPFEEDAALDLGALDAAAADAVRFMDDVVDVSNFPLEAQAREAKAKRRIGLGVTGLADAFVMVGARYGDERSVALTHEWLGRIQRAAYRASARLAAEKGAFPLCDKAKLLKAPGVKALDEETRALIEEHGLRNALLTSIAPTGTISLFAGNVSSGVEPIFALSYVRKVREAGGSHREETVEDYAVRLFRKLKGEDAPLPEAFVTAQDLAPADHLAIQAAAQPHVDSAISKTINCPPDISFEAFKGVYAEAYAMGLKGCTTYRPTPLRGSVLSVAETAKPAEEPRPSADADGPPAAQAPLSEKQGRGPAERGPAERGAIVQLSEPLERDEALEGVTYKLRWPESAHAIYVTINDIIQDGRRRPFEIFINSKNMEHYAWTVALTRMISAVFRRGGDVSFVVEELQAVFDPQGGAWMGGRYVPSLLAAIGDVVEKHMRAIGFLKGDTRGDVTKGRSAAGMEDAAGAEALSVKAGCPRCGAQALRRLEGCDVCANCHWSRCG